MADSIPTGDDAAEADPHGAPPIDHPAGGALGANVVDTNTAGKKSGGKSGGSEGEGKRERKRHKKPYLVIGKLPAGAELEAKELGKYAERLLEEVFRLHGGELGFWHEHLLNLAVAYERHRLLMGWWLRRDEGKLSAVQRRDFSANQGEAANSRNRAVRELLGREKRGAVKGGEPDPAWDKSGDE